MVVAGKAKNEGEGERTGRIHLYHPRWGLFMFGGGRGGVVHLPKGGLSLDWRKGIKRSPGESHHLLCLRSLPSCRNAVPDTVRLCPKLGQSINCHHLRPRRALWRRRLRARAWRCTRRVVQTPCCYGERPSRGSVIFALDRRDNHRLSP